MLGERPDRRIFMALAAGFTGVLVVVSDQFGAGAEARSLAGVGAALVSAVCYAFGLVLLRARAQRDPHGLHRVLPEPRPGADHRPLRLCGMANAGSRRSRLVRAHGDARR